MMRQIAGAFHEYEKARLVVKLRAARERKRADAGKCEGCKSWAEINPALVREAKRLRPPKGHQRSLRDVAAELAKLESGRKLRPAKRWFRSTALSTDSSVERFWLKGSAKPTFSPSGTACERNWLRWANSNTSS